MIVNHSDLFGQK